MKSIDVLLTLTNGVKSFFFCCFFSEIFTIQVDLLFIGEKRRCKQYFTEYHNSNGIFFNVDFKSQPYENIFEILIKIHKECLKIDCNHETMKKKNIV